MEILKLKIISLQIILKSRILLLRAVFFSIGNNDKK
jgi:hypothetical protein